MSIFVVKNIHSNCYAESKHLDTWSDNLNQAFPFRRKCDASGMLNRRKGNERVNYEIISVNLLEAGKPNLNNDTFPADKTKYIVTCQARGTKHCCTGLCAAKDMVAQFARMYDLHQDYFTIAEKYNKWDLRFLKLAKEISAWSKDPSTQTGAVIIGSNKEILSTGYNGFARGVDDNPERYSNRELKYKLVVHCELNAIIFADRDSLKGSTLYTWPFMSCSNCAKHVIQCGIKRCVAPSLPAHLLERWGEDIKLSEIQFKEAGVALDIIPLEDIADV